MKWFRRDSPCPTNLITWVGAPKPTKSQMWWLTLATATLLRLAGRQRRESWDDYRQLAGSVQDSWNRRDLTSTRCKERTYSLNLTSDTCVHTHARMHACNNNKEDQPHRQKKKEKIPDLQTCIQVYRLRDLRKALGIYVLKNSGEWEDYVSQYTSIWRILVSLGEEGVLIN